MPDKGFSKVSPDRFERKIGEAPHIGKVTRTPQSALSNRRGRSRHASRKKQSHTAIKAWSGLLFVVALAVLVVMAALYFRGEAAKRTNSTKPSYASTALDNAFASGQENEVPSLGQAKALEIVTTALEIRDPLMFSEYFIPPAIGTPAEAIAELSQIIVAEGPIVRTQWLGPKFANGRFIEEVVVFTEKDGTKLNRLAQLVPTSGGDWRIDFDSFTRASSAAWEYIINDQIPVAEVRVFLTEDSYYNGMFADDRIWQAYALVSPDAPQILYGYSKKGSPQHSALSRILSAESKLHRATLQVSKLSESGTRQFEISKVLAENWVGGEQPFDESF
jgi:hypothetical protein